MDFYLSALLPAFCFAPLTIGLFLSMKIFNLPDITTDGSYTLGAAVTALGILTGLPISVTVVLACLAGAFAGTITALVHTQLKVNALLAGILVTTGLYSVNLMLMGRSNIPLLDHPTIFSKMNLFLNNDSNTLLVLLFVAATTFLFIGYMLKTDFGIAMRATGESEAMVRALGVNITSMKTIGLAMSNALSALSGCLIAQYQGFADINMGIGIVISGLGAVIVGESLVILFKVKSIFAMLAMVVAGALVFQFAIAITLNMGMDAGMLKLMTALLVLCIVALPRLTGFSNLKGVPKFK